MKEYIIPIILVAAVVVMALLIKFIIGLNEKLTEIRYLEMEVKRSRVEGDHEYWKKKLFCAKASLFPFVSEKAANRMYKNRKKA